jgi:hypothetical protein
MICGSFQWCWWCCSESPRERCSAAALAGALWAFQKAALHLSHSRRPKEYRGYFPNEPQFDLSYEDVELDSQMAPQAALLAHPWRQPGAGKNSVTVPSGECRQICRGGCHSSRSLCAGWAAPCFVLATEGANQAPALCPEWSIIIRSIRSGARKRTKTRQLSCHGRRHHKHPN